MAILTILPTTVSYVDANHRLHVDTSYELASFPDLCHGLVLQAIKNEAWEQGYLQAEFFTLQLSTANRQFFQQQLTM